MGAHLCSRPTRRVGRGGSDHALQAMISGVLAPVPLRPLSSDGRALLCFSLCPRPEVVFLQGPRLWDQSHLRASLYLNPEPLPEVPGFKHQHTNLGDTVQPVAETRMEPR